jgi:hypothetical protein
MLIFALSVPVGLTCEFAANGNTTCPLGFDVILWILILVLWLVGAAPIALVWYLFRPKRRN